MSKKTILAVAVATLAFGQLAKAQTNLQVFYDFAGDRKHVTTTLEGFYNDNWGNTFFFIDYDYNLKDNAGKVLAPGSSYMEIARCLNFWQNSVMGPFSLQVEYNGLIGISQNFLFGVDYFLHSDDFKNTFNFKLLFKTFSGAYNPTSNVPLQFTFVWGMQDIFGVQGLRFSGFADIWGENTRCYSNDNLNAYDRGFVFISEPQLWYNVGQWFGVPNLNLGGEVELSWNFAARDGFYVRPCLGAKWVF
ncbi:MAG: DUF5020 family protein [Bacteroidales bacterium]|nr:DUF5020 family protein [Bacteroidales bacterium]